ncbi:hypothetical protein ACFWIN_37665, partial [Streptomyces sp. NPDC127049]
SPQRAHRPHRPAAPRPPGRGAVQSPCARAPSRAPGRAGRAPPAPRPPPPHVRINPSGGALAANPVMAAGLLRLGEAAARIHRGDSDRALAHATSGPCLQQNLVAVLEGDPR